MTDRDEQALDLTRAFTRVQKIEGSLSAERTGFPPEPPTRLLARAERLVRQVQDGRHAAQAIRLIGGELPGQTAVCQCLAGQDEPIDLRERQSARGDFLIGSRDGEACTQGLDTATPSRRIREHSSRYSW